MIVQVRVDDRLIHGQIAIVWSKHFGTSHMIVANDEAANDEVQKMTLKMATPSGIKVLIKNVEDSINILNDERTKNVKMFVLTDTVQDALEIAKRCEVESINVANVGRFDNSENRIKINSDVTVNEKELEALKELVTLDIETIHWVIPTHNKITVRKLLESVKEA